MPRKALSPQRKRFVDAYLTSANGNGTKAAIAAGYSVHTAGVQASQLLKQPEVKRLVGERLARESLTADQAIENVSALASHIPDKVSDAVILKANELILRVRGKLHDKGSESRVTVNIGFLMNGNPDSGQTAIGVQVMPCVPQVVESGE